MTRYCKVRRTCYSWARVTLLDKNDKVQQGQDGTAGLDGQVIVTLLDKNNKVLQG
jgi:hypothetical protein